MKKWMILAPVIALALFAGRAFADDMADQHPAASASMDKTFKCEVIDVACYIGKGEKGEKHQACAAKCISGGGELALLYNGKLYIPVDSSYHSARDKFVTSGGEVVSVTGKTVSKSGLNYLVLADDKKAE
jgi:hypothetical protein